MPVPTMGCARRPAAPRNRLAVQSVLRRSLRACSCEVTQALREFRRDLPGGELGKMQRLEFVGHEGFGRAGRVYGDGEDEERSVGHIPRPVDGVTPLTAEITLQAALCRTRHDRNEVG